MEDKYDELFESSGGSVFKDKSYLDPLKESEEIISREDQEEQIARFLRGIRHNFLPNSLCIHGPPGTGKTFTTKKICEEFSKRKDEFSYVYVNLKDCRTVFSAANQILLELTGEKLESFEGLDTVFDGIFEALSGHEYFAMVLDEVDKVKHDKNYSSSEFFYRLIRGNKKQETGTDLSLFLISNELFEVDLDLDSRVDSALNDDSVLFPPYQSSELSKIIVPRLRKSFKPEALDSEAIKHGLSRMARRSGDVRKALTVFREAGETADKRGLDEVTVECIDENLEEGKKHEILNKLNKLRDQQLLIMHAITSCRDPRTEKTKQPVTSNQVRETYRDMTRGREDLDMSRRMLRQIINDLEGMGLLETWVKAKDEGRAKKIRTTYKPEWTQEAINKLNE